MPSAPTASGPSKLVRVRRNHAVKTIDLELEEREIVTVQGANGTRDIVDGISDDQLRTWTQAATMAIGLLFIGRALVLLTDVTGNPS